VELAAADQPNRRRCGWNAAVRRRGLTVVARVLLNLDETITKVTRPMARDFDSPKEALISTEPLLAFLFPDVHAAIDWTKGYESRQGTARDSSRRGTGTNCRRQAVSGALFNGENVWLLIPYRGAIAARRRLRAEDVHILVSDN
jgi:hypothetical protein